jgi:hypothetical protein
MRPNLKIEATLLWSAQKHGQQHLSAIGVIGGLPETGYVVTVGYHQDVPAGAQSLCVQVITEYMPRHHAALIWAPGMVVILGRSHNGLLGLWLGIRCDTLDEAKALVAKSGARYVWDVVNNEPIWPDECDNAA